MSYTQLTPEQRYHSWAMKQAGFNQMAIAHDMGVHMSTISRELRRNTGQRGYRPNQAHTLAMSRQQVRARTPRITAETWEMVDDYLRQEWSPEQVSGRLWRQHGVRVSHERIYLYVYDCMSRMTRGPAAPSLRICAVRSHAASVIAATTGGDNLPIAAVSASGLRL